MSKDPYHPKNDSFYEGFVERVSPIYWPRLAAQWREEGESGREFWLTQPMRTHPRKEGLICARRFRMRAARLERHIKESQA